MGKGMWNTRRLRIFGHLNCQILSGSSTTPTATDGRKALHRRLPVPLHTEPGARFEAPEEVLHFVQVAGVRA